MPAVERMTTAFEHVDQHMGKNGDALPQPSPATPTGTEVNLGGIAGG